MNGFVIALAVIAALIVIILLAYLLVFVRPRGRKPEDSALLCDYAHRGLFGNGLPENSLGAFERACQEGYGIELDVQLSRDGVVMVFHDYTLNRMTGVEKKLCELDADELKNISLGGTEEKIPTFEEVLALVNGRVPLLVELKGENLDTSLCPKVAQLLKEYKGPYCIESFNPLLIKDIQKYLPDAYIGQLYTNVCKDKKKYSALNIALSLMALNFLAAPDFIAYNHKCRKSFPVCIATGLYRAPKFVWTIKTDKGVETAHKNGEHPIFEREWK